MKDRAADFEEVGRQVPPSMHGCMHACMAGFGRAAVGCLSAIQHVRADFFLTRISNKSAFVSRLYFFGTWNVGISK